MPPALVIGRSMSCQIGTASRALFQQYMKILIVYFVFIAQTLTHVVPRSVTKYVSIAGNDGQFQMECKCYIPLPQELIDCSFPGSSECHDIAESCFCDPALRLQKRGLGSVISKCFGLSAGVVESGVPDGTSTGTSKFVDDFVKDYSIDTKLEVVLDEFNTKVDDLLSEVQDARERAVIKDRLNIELSTRFVPTLEESRAVFKEASSQSVRDRFRAILEETVAKQPDPSSYDGLLENFKFVGIDEFKDHLRATAGVLRDNTEFQKNGILLTRGLRELHSAQTKVKSIDWMASHLLHAEKIRPKFVFDSEVIDAHEKLPMKPDFYDSMDYFYKSLKGKSLDPITMQMFLIDDATYSGTQIAKTIFNLNRYLEVNQDVKIDLHLSLAFATDAARAKIIGEVEFVNQRNGGRFQVQWEGEPAPIPAASEVNSNYKYPGALAFEYKIPDELSWGGPFEQMNENVYETALKNALSSKLPPYKEFTPELNR